MKYKLMSIVFCGLLLLGMGLNLMTPDRDISFTERRPLAQAPQIDGEFLTSEDGGEKVESYLLDQFWNRDGFRRLKVWFDQRMLNKSDSNGLYQIGDHLFKINYPLNVSSVEKAAQKMMAIREKLLGEADQVAYAVIPDKAHYAPDREQYLSVDYDEMTDILKEGLPEMEYVSLEEHLELDDYYNTDLHWRQENLEEVTEAIWEHFGIEGQIDTQSMEVGEYEPFYGAYYGQIAASGDGDRLVWLRDEEIDGLQVTDYDEMKEIRNVVYAEEKLGTVDSYELFFGGNSPLIVIDNPQCNSGERLVIFRDSFASAIAPLLAKEYSQVVLVDLRFMGYEFLDQFVDFKGADVLFLWEQQVYNDSSMIRAR